MNSASSSLKRVGRSIIAQMPGVLEDHEPRVVADQVLEPSASLDRDEHVVAAPHDQRRDLDLAQPVAERVVQQRLERGDEPGLSGAVDELRGERDRQPLRIAHDDLQRGAPQPRPVDDRRCCRPRRAAPTAIRRPIASTGSRRRYSVESPAAETSTSLRDARRERERQLGADEAAHRVADHDRRRRSPSRRTARRSSGRSRGSRSGPPALGSRRSPAGRSPCTRCGP